MMRRSFEDLEKLGELLKKDIISEAEFNTEKDKILGKSSNGIVGNLFGLNENTYCFLIHISVLLGFLHLVLGLVAPIILWTLNRENNQTIDAHGKNVLNWILSFAIYMSICLIIVFPLNSILHLSLSLSYDFSLQPQIFSGFLPITLLMIINILFILVGGIKASSGVVWKYPFSLKFFKK